MPNIAADAENISDINNSSFPERIAKHLSVERTWLYQPETDWFYSHHPYLAYFAGEYHAIWSSGRIDEDSPGQRIAHCVSTDLSTWSDPTPLVDSTMGVNLELILTSGGFHVHEGGMNVYVGEYEVPASALDDEGRMKPDIFPRLRVRLRAVATKDGRSWSAPIDQEVCLLANHGPFALKSGRLILPGHTMFPYTDDSSGLSGWTPAGIYPDDPGQAPIDHNPEALETRVAWPIKPCEASGYQTDDGVIHMLLRSATPWLWVTESFDEGRTYSSIRPTRFSDNVSRFQFGRLPDGRFFYLGTPDQTGGSRWRLVVSLSDDGISFDRHYVLVDDADYVKKKQGLYKGGNFGYPHMLVHDGTLLAIVSRQKESVEVYRTSLSALE